MKKKLSFIILLCLLVIAVLTLCACAKTDAVLKFEDIEIRAEDAFSLSNTDYLVEYSINNAAQYMSAFNYTVSISVEDTAGNAVTMNGNSIRVDDKRETYFVTITVTSGDKSVSKTVTINGKFIAETVEDGTYFIKGYNADFFQKDNIDLEIPETHNGKTVSGISKRAFFENKKIVSVSIPENIKTIGKEAFYGCTALASVEVLGSGLETVSEKAFMNCTALSDINKAENVNSLPESLLNLEAYAFRNTAIENFSFPSKIEEISDSSFSFCYNLTSYSAKGTIKYIGAFAFEGSAKLNSVDLSGVIEVRAGAFKSCTSIEKLEIPASVTLLEKSAFRYCTALRIVKVTSEVKAATIEDFVFDGIHPSFKIYVPDDRYNRYYEGEGWSSYSDYVEPDEDEDEEVLPEDEDEKFNHIYKNSVLKGENNSFAVIDTEGGLELVQYIGESANVVIPSEIDGKLIVKIGENSFNSTAIETLVLPNSVKEVAKKAFYKCSLLTSLDLGSGVQNIGEQAFAFCTSLTSLTLPDSVVTVGESAFAHLEKVTSLYIGAGLKNISNGAFVTEVSLKEFSVAPLNPNLSVSDGILYSFDKKTLIAYPSGKEGTSFTIPASVENIGYGAFYGYSFKDIYTEEVILEKRFPALTEVIIPETVLSIGEKAFYQCPYLEKIIIGDNPLMEIKKNAFGECPAFTYLELPAGILADNSENEEWNYYGAEKITTVVIKGLGELTKICDYAFYLAENLTSVTLENVTEIGNGAFMLAKNLKENAFVCDSALQVIGKKAFYGTEWEKTSPSGIFINDVLVSFTLGENKNITISGMVKKIAPNVFSELSGLISVNITAETLVEIGADAFKNCTALTEISLPDSLSKIGESAFYGCSALVTVNGALNGLTTIEKEAFKGCASLSGLPALKASTIGDNAFDGCKALKNVSFNVNLQTLGNYAFRNCGLTIFNVPESVTEIGIGVVQASSDITEMNVVFTASASYLSYYFGSPEPTRSAVPSALKKVSVLKAHGGKIGNNAFYQAGNVETIILSNTVSSIGKNAFYASGVKNLTLLSSAVVTLEADSMVNVSADLIVKVPSSAVSAYEADSNWNSFTIQEA